MLQVREEDLRNSLDVISQLWEMMAESLSAYDSLESYRIKLEERWEAEKAKRRQVERVSTKQYTSFIFILLCCYAYCIGNLLQLVANNHS